MNTTQRRHLRLCAATLFYLFAMVLTAFSLLGPRTACAQSTWVGDTSSDWNNAANWSSDPANPTGDYIINNTAGPGVFPVASATPGFTPVDIRVGTGGATGRLDQTAGTLSTGNGNWFFLGYQGGTGIQYNLADTTAGGGTLTGFGQGSGSLNLGGASLNGNLLVGLDNSTVSTVNMNTTGAITGAGIFLGANGGSNGHFNMDSGTVTLSGEFQVGANFFGQGSGNNNTFNMSGGTVTAQIFSLARGNNNAAVMTGTATLTGGTLNTRQWFTLGFAGSATDTSIVNNNGGTINVNTSGGGQLEMGVFDSTQNTFNQNSGILTLQNNAPIVFGNGGNQSGSATATFNQNNGTVTFYSDAGATVGGTGSVNLGNGGSTGTYTYNLNGGTLTVPQVQKTAAGASGTFNFNGGTLKPTANNATFLQGLTRANVRNGGAIVDTNGVNVTVGQQLQHSNIGSDNAIDGGLTKQGAGTLTLTANNSYTGNTTVQAGTLALNSSASNNNIGASQKIIVGDTPANNLANLDVTGITAAGLFHVLTNQTLAGYGTVTGAVTVDNGGTVGPGNSTGTLAITGNTTLNGSLATDIDDSQTPKADKLAVGGTLDISGATSAVSFNVTGTPTQSAYIIASYGSLLGTWNPSNIFNLPSGYSINYNYLSGNNIALVQVPEPSAIVLASLGLVGLVRLKRRRK